MPQNIDVAQNILTKNVVQNTNVAQKKGVTKILIKKLNQTSPEKIIQLD